MAEQLSPFEAYKQLIDELIEKHTEDSFKERLLLEVLPSAFGVLSIGEAVELRKYALERLKKR